MAIDPNPQHTPLDGAPGTQQSGEAQSDYDGLMARFVEWFKLARDRRHEWRKEAEECEAYVAGHQWSDEDAFILADQERPAIVFNRIGPFIDSVSGLEINNRQELRYIPRQIGAGGVNELLTGAAKWVRDECDAEDEESEAFRDCLVVGEGWVQTHLDYDHDPDGMIVMERRDPLKIYPDPSATKRNYSDARYIFYVSDLPRQVAEQMAPQIDAAELDARWARDRADESTDPHNARLAPFYRIDQAGEVDREDHYVRLVEVEWWEYETAYRVLDPSTGKMVRLDTDKFNAFRAAARSEGASVASVRDRRRRYYRALLGNVIIDRWEGNERGGFSLKAITGKHDRKKHCYYGLVRAMKDPQQWSNKWLSQTLNIINKNSKGGLMAEQSAFANPQEAEDEWARPDSITWVNDGALRNGAIKEKPPIAYPQGLDRLMQYAVDSISGVIGANPEMMGQADRAQSGVVEHSRKQAAMTVFADLFNSLRRYRKDQGRLLLWLIQEFISDGRLVRIGGPSEAQYVPLVRQPHLEEYDVVVDDTPTSPNMKERAWGAITQLMPILARLALPPSMMLEMLKYSPLPDTLTAKLEQMAQQAAAQPQSDPLKAAQADVEKAHAEQALANAQKARADAQHSAAKTAMLPQHLALELQAQQAKIEQQRAQAIAALAQVGLAQGDQGLAAAELAIDSLLQSHAQAHDVRQTDDQNAIAAYEAAQKAAVAQQNQAAQALAAQTSPQPSGNQG